MRVLCFTISAGDLAITGRELLADLNSRALRSIFGPDLFHVTVNASRKPIGLREKVAALAGWLDGLDSVFLNHCLHIIASKRIDVVYIEGSNYGRLARAVRKAAPNCSVVTFFHNVESRFFWGAFKAHPSIKALAVLFANWLVEGWAVRFSDRIICLNKRDSYLLLRLYRRAATDIHPLCLDGAPPTVTLPWPNDLTYGLFVGGAFYANLQGARWLAREVAHMLPCQIIIIGKGFEKYRDELEAHPNITVVGTVDSVARWYEHAAFVVAPIFDGSGMKTKVAEALMYGKPVIGTPEAFVGYEAVGERAGIICEDSVCFASAIRKIYNGERFFNPLDLQSLFTKNYSYAAKLINLKKTFGLM